MTWKQKLETFPVFCSQTRLLLEILDIVLCHSQGLLQADLHHDITEEELEAYRKHFNFTEAHFTSAKTYLALEHKIRAFAQHVKDQVFEHVQEKKDEKLEPDDTVPIVLNTVTHGRTNCSC